ncbi:uncharacterized protein TNCV_3301571 [Trichonephila clavipes]|nr:uncharacterized protein TNCV_3301571 [Trichonephila clavipes]
MAGSKKKSRLYSVDYLKFGFIEFVSDKRLPLCLLCNRVLSNDAMKPSKLEDHLRRCHPDKSSKDLKYFQILKERLQNRPTMDRMFASTLQRDDNVAAVAEWYGYRTVACLVTSSSPVPLKTRRVGQRCTLNLSRAETSSRWCGVVVRRGECQLSLPKFEGPYRVLEVRKNNLIILKRGKKVTVNIDQVRVYRPRQSDTISSDSHLETLYEGQRSSDRSSRSQPGKFKGSRKTSSEESNDHKSRITAHCAGPSPQQDSRQDKPPTEGSRHEGSGQYNKARETKTTKNGTNRAAERRPVRTNQMTAVRPCPYYLSSRVRQPEGFPEERRNSGIHPQNNIRRRSLSMETLDGDPVDRSE